MPPRAKDNHLVLLLTVGLLGWLIPGAGHFVIKEKARAIIIFAAIVLTFSLGLYVGSIAVVNPVTGKLAYAAQIMNSPMVAVIGRLSVKGHYSVFGKPNEIGQIYTSIAGLLNLLCIVNAVYLAHVRKTEPAGA
ncbi:MAG: hypothetical protein H8E73_00825 [Planctomycetes bacterium]|nr:hypothetical protein [Planctomycetota bacterium]MBL7153665.1 hypothetical protein [Phycisphaerae bacterium]